MEIEASIGEWSLEVIGSEPETRGVRVVLSAVQLCGVTLKYRFLTSCHRPVRARTVPYGVRIGCALRLCAQVTKTLCRRAVVCTPLTRMSPGLRGVFGRERGHRTGREAAV